MSPPSFHKMDDTSVHFDSTKSLVTIGEVRDGALASTSGLAATIVKDKSPKR